MSNGSKSQALPPDALAARLRAMQVDLADEPAETRRGYLADEIDAALAALVPEERTAYLEKLKDRFPAWDAVEYRVGGGEGRTEPAADDDQLADPFFLVERLARVAPTLDEAKRRALTDQLSKAGVLVLDSDRPWTEEAEERITQAAPLPEGARIDPTRVADAVASLAAVCHSLDQLGWSTWKQIAPKSAMRRRAPIRETIGGFLSTDQRASKPQLDEDLERLRKLVAGLVSAISQVGPVVFQMMESQSPEKIEQLSKLEKRWHEGAETACWRKYQELAGSLDEASVEARVLEAVSDYAESLIGGQTR
ncbi:MAG: hypothetical protein AAGB51_11545 [Planctomycetota bacterium]